MKKLIKAIMDLPLGHYFLTQALLNHCEMVLKIEKETYPKNHFIDLALLQSTAESVRDLIFAHQREVPSELAEYLKDRTGM